MDAPNTALTVCMITGIGTMMYGLTAAKNDRIWKAGGALILIAFALGILHDALGVL